MRKLLFIFLIIFSSQSFADLTGKGIVCEEYLSGKEEDKIDILGVFFKSKLMYEMYSVSGDSVSTTTSIYIPTTNNIHLSKFKGIENNNLWIMRDDLIAQNQTPIKDYKVLYKCSKTEDIFQFDKGNIEEMQRLTKLKVQQYLKRLKSKRQL